MPQPQALRKIIRALCTRSENEFCLHSNVVLSILVRCFVGWKKTLHNPHNITLCLEQTVCLRNWCERLVCVERRTLQTQLTHLALCTCITCTQSCLCSDKIPTRAYLFFISSTYPPTNEHFMSDSAISCTNVCSNASGLNSNPLTGFVTTRTSCSFQSTFFYSSSNDGVSTQTLSCLLYPHLEQGAVENTSRKCIIISM